MATTATNISIHDYLNRPARLGGKLREVAAADTGKALASRSTSGSAKLEAVSGFNAALPVDVLPAGETASEPSALVRTMKASFAALGKYLIVRVLPGLLTIATILTMAAMLGVGSYDALGAGLLLAAAVKSLSYQGLRALLQTHLEWRDEGLVFALIPCLIAGASLHFIAVETSSGQLLWLFAGMAVLLAQSIQELHLEHRHPAMWLRRRAGVMLARTLVTAAVGLLVISFNAPVPLVGLAMMSVWLQPAVWALLTGGSTPAVTGDVFAMPARATLAVQTAAAGKAL